MAAVRVGDRKALLAPPPKGPGRWEWYDLSTDLGEVHNLAESRPGKLREMLGHYETYFQETGMFDSILCFGRRSDRDRHNKVFRKRERRYIG